MSAPTAVPPLAHDPMQARRETLARFRERHEISIDTICGTTETSSAVIAVPPDTVPRRVHVTATLPKTPTGKIRRRALRGEGHT